MEAGAEDVTIIQREKPMNSTKTARHQELQRQIDELGERTREAFNDFTSLDAKLEERRRDLVSLEERRTQACRREALGERSDRIAIESEIANAKARITGIEVLLGERQAEVSRLRAEMEPLSRELAELLHKEEIERQSREIQERFNEGKAAILVFWAAERKFARLLADLRGYTDPAVQSAAYNGAAALESARAGVRVHELFGPEELKAFS